MRVSTGVCMCINVCVITMNHSILVFHFQPAITVVVVPSCTEIFLPNSFMALSYVRTNSK